MHAHDEGQQDIEDNRSRQTWQASAAARTPVSAHDILNRARTQCATPRLQKSVFIIFTK